MVDPFRHGVVRCPSSPFYSGHVETNSRLKQSSQVVSHLTSPRAISIDWIRVERFEVRAELLSTRIVMGKDLDLRMGIFIEAFSQAQHSLSFLNLGVQVALVHDRDALPDTATLREIQGVLANDANGREVNAKCGCAVVGVAEQQELVHEIIAVVHADLAGQLGQEPNTFALSQGPSCVVPQSTFGNDCIEKSKGLVVLHRHIAVAYYAKHNAGIGPYYALPLRDRCAVSCCQRLQIDPIVQARCFDRFTSGCRLVELCSKAMPRNFTSIHHCGFAIGGGEIVGHLSLRVRGEGASLTLRNACPPSRRLLTEEMMTSNFVHAKVVAFPNASTPLNNPMITAITLEGLLGAKDQTIKLLRLGKVTSVVGPNSAGKTTLIVALHSILCFLSKRTPLALIDPALDKWFMVKKARVTVRPESGEISTSLSGLIFAGQDITFEVERLPTNELALSHISTSMSSLSMKTRSISRRASEKERNQVQVTLKQKQQRLNDLVSQQATRKPSTKNKPADVAAAKKRSQQEIAALKRAIAEIKSQQKKNSEEQFTFTDGSKTEHIITTSHIEDFLKDLPVPQCHYIPFHKSPGEEQTLDSMIREAVKSKKGPKQNAYERICKGLSHLLEAKVIAFEEQDKAALTADAVDSSKLSNGARICLMYYSLINGLKEDAVIIWDEPENGLHSTRRSKLMDLLLNDTRQFILATHATELCAVLDPQCEVYRLFADRTQEPPPFILQHATSRRDAFIIAEDLGLRPSTTLFTANVVLWVEGPSDLLFWRHWIQASKSKHGLVEGFDFTIMQYGGSNLFHMSAVDDIQQVTGFDLLALCRYAIVVVDSDLAEAEDDDLKPAATAMSESVDSLNQLRTGAGLFVKTAGREIENYLPDEAVRFAVKELAKFKVDQEALAKLDELVVDQHEHYFEKVESHLLGRGVHRTIKEKLVAVGKSKWGEKGKVEFMRKALAMPELSVASLKWDGPKVVADVITFISEHRRE